MFELDSLGQKSADKTELPCFGRSVALPKAWKDFAFRWEKLWKIDSSAKQLAELWYTFGMSLEMFQHVIASSDAQISGGRTVCTCFSRSAPFCGVLCLAVNRKKCFCILHVSAAATSVRIEIWAFESRIRCNPCVDTADAFDEAISVVETTTATLDSQDPLRRLKSVCLLTQSTYLSIISLTVFVLPGSLDRETLSNQRIMGSYFRHPVKKLSGQTHAISSLISSISCHTRNR